MSGSFPVSHFSLRALSYILLVFLLKCIKLKDSYIYFTLFHIRCHFFFFYALFPRLFFLSRAFRFSCDFWPGDCIWFFDGLRLFFSSFIIFLWGVTGSQWQSKIWSNFHVKHSWPSHILSANSCRPWSCTEQVSSWMLVYWNLPFSSFSFANLWWYLIWFLFFFAVSCQPFQLEKGLSSAGGGIGCWRDGKTSQSIDCVHQHAESFGMYMHQFFFSVIHRGCFFSFICYGREMCLLLFLARCGNRIIGSSFAT